MEKHDRNIALIRTGMAAVMLSAVAFPHVFQPAVDSVWSVIRVRTLFRASFFETIWTTGWYITIEVRM